ncbi:uncharacterized protein LOC125756556 [Rhipicephalus sanguineus]|uniref:uncharacterized protein LOC125756556 n=1 Tax=Rhipicephalus sanguineus TaxID=34632 RepID=UPI0020C3DDFD|nr:uncharacterized protein LOC125756556 [Rhipicephalus sanguineus]
MVSFDVKSLYTSVPIDFAVKVCTEALESDPSLPERTPLEAPDLSRLLEFCLSNTYLTFQKKFFKQVHGTATGASISVTAANFAMESLESRALSSFSSRPRVFLRYVDDCFSVVKKSALSAFLLHLNSMDPAIQFTTEEEVNGRLPFLEVLVKRDGSRLSFSVFRKETHTGKYLSFSSVHLMCQKKSVVASLVRRAEKLSSTPENQAAELATIRRDLSSSGYPSSLIQAVKKSLAHPTPNDSQQHNDKGRRKRIPVPYVPGISGLSRILRGYEVDVAHVPTRKLRQAVGKVKDKLDKEKFPGVVYRIPCADCNQVYIGETGDFGKRIKQHSYDVKTKHVATNALAEYAVSTSHDIDWDSAKIIGKEKDKSARLHLESLHIQTTDNTLNRNSGNLPPIYTRCLRHIIKPI